MKNKKVFAFLIFLTLLGVLIAIQVKVWIKRQQESIKKWKDSSDKYFLYTNVLLLWLSKKQTGSRIEEYLLKHNLKRIAIYGMGVIGERLLDELKDSTIEVAYAIDQNSDTIWADVEVFSPEENMPEIDAIIVTAIYYFDSIENILKEKTNYRVISLEDILCAI